MMELCAAPTLEEALDTTGVVWTSGGDTNWFGQTALTHDGVDATRAGTVFDNQTNWIQTTVTGVTNLTFWWKVSSEKDYDFLQFKVDDGAPSSISGEVDWQQRTFTLNSGTHRLTWQYVKDTDDSFPTGQDTAWLDEVVMTTIPPTAPTILTQPTNQTAGIGAEATFAVNVIASPFPSYQWRFNGGDIAGATNSTHTIFDVAATNAGEYTVAISNSLDAVTSAVARLSVILLPDALDATTLPWTVGGARPWHGEIATTHDGVDAGESGWITHDQETWMQTTINGPNTLSFWWKVSSEAGFDMLELYLDSTRQTRISGEVDWQFYSLDVPAGNHTVRWRYSKDPGDLYATGQDRAWVDQVSLATPPGSFYLGPPVPLADGSRRITLFGESGRNYTIQASTNFISWMEVTNFLSTTSVVSVVDIQATNKPVQFYRGAVTSP
jgi:hypothetical protein